MIPPKQYKYKKICFQKWPVKLHPSDLIFGILYCNLQKDTIDVDLKICTLQGIYTYKKDRSSQVSKYSPWGTEVTPFPSLQKKMIEYLRQRQVVTTSYANRLYQPGPKATATRRTNLVTLTRANREKLSQPRKMNVGPLPKTKPRSWLATIRARELEATAARQALPNQ